MTFEEWAATVERGVTINPQMAFAAGAASRYAEIAELVAALKLATTYHEKKCDCAGCKALAATPEQSLARIRNQVREECADACEEYQGSAETCATRIRAMKEPE